MPAAVVFKSDRRTKDRHDAVAGKALYDTTLLTDTFAQSASRESGSVCRQFLSRPLRKGREAHHIGEQDRDLSAPGVQAALRPHKRHQLVNDKGAGASIPVLQDRTKKVGDRETFTAAVSSVMLIRPRRNGCAPMEQIADRLEKLSMSEYTEHFAENVVPFSVLHISQIKI